MEDHKLAARDLCRKSAGLLLAPVAVVLMWLGITSSPGIADVHEMVPTEQGKTETVKLNLVGKEAFDVRVLTIQEKPVSPEVVVPGRVEVPPNQSFRIHTLQEGRICRIFVSLGQRVKEGQVLLWLDSAEINRLAAETLQRRAEIEAELAQTETMLNDEVNQTESKFVLAKAAFERSQQLFNELIAARKEFEQALSEFEVATTRVTAAKKKRQQILAALNEKLSLTIEPLKQRLVLLGLSESAIDDILKTKRTVVCVPVRSSHEGVIVAIKTTLGQSVSPADELFTVADLSRMWIKGQVFESDVARIYEGQQVSVRVPAVPQKLVTGRLSYISAEVDPGARTLPVAAEVGNENLLLKSGMYAEMHIQAKESRARPVIPVDAILQRNGKKYVLAQTIGVFKPVEVQLGHGFDNHVEIREGLKGGDRVVVEGAFQLEGALLASGAKEISIDDGKKPANSVSVPMHPKIERILGWREVAAGLGIFASGVLTGLLLLKIRRNRQQDGREEPEESKALHQTDERTIEVEHLGRVDRW